MTTGPRYPNQQLRAVALETYFLGRLSVFTDAALVQKRFAEAFPKLYVPHTKGGEALYLRPFQLRSADDTSALAISLNQVSYVSLAYPGHQQFLADAIPALSSTLEILGVYQLQRVIFRYENEIGLGRFDDGTLPLESVFGFTLPDSEGPRGLQSCDIDTTRKWDHGQVGVKIGVVTENGGDVLKFSIVVAVLSPGPLADLETRARLAHDEAVRRFESMISEDFRHFLKGEKPA